MQPVGKQLRDLRRGTGLGLKRVAPRVGVTHSHLSKVENGVKQPSVDLVIRLSAFYGSDVDELLAAMGELPHDVIQILRTEGKAAINLLRAEYAKPSDFGNDD